LPFNNEVFPQLGETFAPLYECQDLLTYLLEW